MKYNEIKRFQKPVNKIGFSSPLWIGILFSLGVHGVLLFLFQGRGEIKPAKTYTLQYEYEVVSLSQEELVKAPKNNSMLALSTKANQAKKSLLVEKKPEADQPLQSQQGNPPPLEQQGTEVLELDFSESQKNELLESPELLQEKRVQSVAFAVIDSEPVPGNVHGTSMPPFSRVMNNPNLKPDSSLGIEAVSSMDQTTTHVVGMIHQSFLNTMNRLKRYPLSARRRGMEGEALFEVFFDVNGIISKIALKRSSGYEILDKNARQLIHTVGLLAVPLTQTVSFYVPIAYRLR